MEKRSCHTCGVALDENDACIWNALTGKTFCGDACSKMYLRVGCADCGAPPGKECEGKAVHRERYSAVLDYVSRLKMTPIEELIDRSSLGTPRAKRLRGMAPGSVVRQILKRADELSPLAQRTLREKYATEPLEGGWERFEPTVCDLCPCIAVWRHPSGGYRCNTCPRPPG